MARPNLRSVPKDETGTKTSEDKHEAMGRGGRLPSKRTSLVMPGYWDQFIQREADREGTSRTAIILRSLSEYHDKHFGQAGAWDTVDDDPGYDPLKFYTHTQDKKGHSAQVRVNYPKPLAGELAGLVQSGRIPQYNSVEAIFRDAVMHRARYIARMIDDEKLEAVVNLAMLMAEELAIEAREKEADELVAQVNANASRMSARSDWPRLKKYLAEREPYVEMLPEPWRTQMKDDLARFKARVKGKD